MSVRFRVYVLMCVCVRKLKFYTEFCGNYVEALKSVLKAHSIYEKDPVAEAELVAEPRYECGEACTCLCLSWCLLSLDANPASPSTLCQANI